MTALLLATGARPRRLRSPGEAGGRSLYLRTLTDALAHRATRSRPAAASPSSAAASSAWSSRRARVERGAAVTRHRGAAAHPDARRPAEIAALVAARHRAAGVDISLRRRHRGASRRPAAAHRRSARRRRGDRGRRSWSSASAPCRRRSSPRRRPGDRQRHRRRRTPARPAIRTSSPPAIAAPSRMPLYGGRRIRLEAWRNAQDQGALAARNMLGRRREPCRGAVVLVRSI